jgi:hypothetical protein
VAGAANASGRTCDPQIAEVSPPPRLARASPGRRAFVLIVGSLDYRVSAQSGRAPSRSRWYMLPFVLAAGIPAARAAEKTRTIPAFSGQIALLHECL